jgi:hypothetical protein
VVGGLTVMPDLPFCRLLDFLKSAIGLSYSISPSFYTHPPDGQWEVVACVASKP